MRNSRSMHCLMKTIEGNVVIEDEPTKHIKRPILLFIWRSLLEPLLKEDSLKSKKDVEDSGV